MYALGDDQMAEAKGRQQKERSNTVVKIYKRRAERDSEALKGAVEDQYSMEGHLWEKVNEV